MCGALQDHVKLGNLNATRDWGHARDYVECMWLMLQQDEPDDYVIATNETHSIREFLDLAFARANLAAFKVPRSVDFVTDLPRSEAGKIQRNKVRAPYWEGRARQI